MKLATWMVHFRIADHFLNKLDVNPEKFVIGSVAPDCGYGSKDSYGEFIPPPTVTHWSPSGIKKDCRYKDFYKCYLINRAYSRSDFSFYLGYYIHLLTDIMWSCMVFAPTKIKYAKNYARNPDFLLTIKKDWNDLDFKYLAEHPNFKPFKLLEETKAVKDYLPYYEPKQLTIQSRFIVNYYKKDAPKHNYMREFKFLKAADVDNFVSCACEIIEHDLRKKLSNSFI